MDEIARRAEANKAMIYYHFRSKESLYKAAVLSQIGSLRDRVLGAVVGETDPIRRLQRLYRAVGAAFQESPAVPHMMIREVLAGGVHIDSEVAAAFRGIVDVVRGAVEEGRLSGRIRRVDPLFVHVTMIASLILLNISEPYRDRLLPVAAPDTPRLSHEIFHAQLEDALERILVPGQEQVSGTNGSQR